jgi:16S rRNA (uracil1498-N3)-methyltransferase
VNRIPVPQGSLREGPMQLPEDEGRKLRTVLRLQVGDELELFDGAGAIGTAVISQMAEPVTVQVLEVVHRPVAPPLWIAQALPKGDKLELVIQKATELGAAGLIPFSSERTVVKLDPRKAHDRHERWRKIAIEAARQCGRADVPAIGELCDLPGVLARAGAKGLLYEGATDLRLGEFLDRSGAAQVTLIIGPEGGFAESEVQLARDAGAQIVGLGSRILRTETVALAALAVALFKRGELG